MVASGEQRSLSLLIEHATVVVDGPQGSHTLVDIADPPAP